MYNRNVAYDFGAREEHRKRGSVVRIPGHEARRRERLKSKRKVLSGIFSLFLMSAAGVSVFVAGQVKLTEATDQVEKASKELEQCESSNMQLFMQLESKSADRIKNSGIRQTEIVKIPKEVVSEVH